MKFKHISIVARNASRLARFYEQVFGCKALRPEMTLRGEKVGRGNGLPTSEIRSIWLTLPGVDGAFLEIHEYKERQERPTPKVNEPGYGHLAFEVGDISTVSSAIINAGGATLGEITDFGTSEAPILIVYLRDPEGNILELEQR